MSIDLTDLVLALHEEHKQRTGHEGGKARPEYLVCMVCVYLRKLMAQAEEAYYAARPAAGGGADA